MKNFLAMALLIPSIASAQFLNGNKLLENMRSENVALSGMAVGYVMAISDVYQNQGHCSGPNVTSGQSRDVVKKFLEANPAIRDMSADLLVLVALAEAFPCKQPERKDRRQL
jgi:hypothetical protein